MSRAQVRDEGLTIFGEAARKSSRYGRPGAVLEAPSNELYQDWQQIEGLLGRLINHAPRVRVIRAPRGEACGLEQFEAAREDVRRDTFVALQQLPEVALAPHDEVAQHDERPAVADQIEGAGDGAVGAARR